MTDIKFGEAGRYLICNEPRDEDDPMNFHIYKTLGKYDEFGGQFEAVVVNLNIQNTTWNVSYKYWEDVTEKFEKVFENMLESMLLDSKIAYLKTALNICKIPVEDKIAELVISLYEEILKKHGETSLMDISRIQVEIEEKYESKKKSPDL